MAAQNFLSQLTTTKDVDGTKKQLEELQRKIYTASEKLDQYMSDELGDDQKASLLKHFNDKKIDTNDPLAVEKEIQSIINSLAEIPVVDLIVAVVPKQILLREMLNQIEESSGKRPVFRVYLSEDILGGAVFEVNGIEYRDTVEQKIKDLKLI